MSMLEDMLVRMPEKSALMALVKLTGTVVCNREHHRKVIPHLRSHCHGERPTRNSDAQAKPIKKRRAKGEIQKGLRRF